MAASRHFAFDTEDNSRGKCFLYNFYEIETETHSTFIDQESALDFVCSHPRSIYWAVNLEYDLNNLFRGYFGFLRFIYAGSRLITAELFEDRIRFYDTMNHWQLSVKKMGDRIGLPKLEMRHGQRAPNKKALKKALQCL